MCTAQTVTGDEPPSLNGCTLTLIDQHTAVLFGGYDGHEYRNDTYLLDMEKWVRVLLAVQIMRALFKLVYMHVIIKTGK